MPTLLAKLPIKRYIKQLKNTKHLLQHVSTSTFYTYSAPYCSLGYRKPPAKFSWCWPYYNDEFKKEEPFNCLKKYLPNKNMLIFDNRSISSCISGVLLAWLEQSYQLLVALTSVDTSPNRGKNQPLPRNDDPGTRPRYFLSSQAFAIQHTARAARMSTFSAATEFS